MKKVACISAILALGITGTAHAQNGCDDLDGNIRWKQLLQEFSDQFKGGDYNAALKTTEKLQEICTRSPVLNYSIGQTHKELGNLDKAKYYFQKATDNATDFQVRGPILEKLWFERFKAEHPEMLQSQDELTKNQQTLEDLNAALEESRKQQAATERISEKYQTSELNTYKALMWSGVAVGTAGLAIAITGGTLMAVNKGDNIDQSRPGQVKIKEMHNVSVGLLSAGIVATVTGAMAAGFGGYLYFENRPKEDETISLQITPTSAVLTYQF